MGAILTDILFFIDSCGPETALHPCRTGSDEPMEFFGGGSHRPLQHAGQLVTGVVVGLDTVAASHVVFRRHLGHAASVALNLLVAGAPGPTTARLLTRSKHQQT